MPAARASTCDEHAPPAAVELPPAPAPEPGLVPVEAGLVGLVDAAASWAGDPIWCEVRVGLFPRNAGKARVVDVRFRIKTVKRARSCILDDEFCV